MAHNTDKPSVVDAQVDFTRNADGTYSVRLSNTTERNFEDDVERIMHEAGWTTFEDNAAAQADYDRKLALKVGSLIGFVRETQPREWAKLERVYGAGAEAKFLKRLASELEPHQDRGGVVDVLRRGIDMTPGAHFRLCYFRPASGKNPTAVSNYEANRFELVRQLRFGTLASDERDSVDVTLFLNGIPVATMELKNNLTGQRTEHAVAQYKRDRSPKEVLFSPNRRAIVHFALDSETVQMCTWLRGKGSNFLPFNRGNGMAGGGNPANPHGYRTEYLYRDVLAPDSLLDIIQRFVSVRYSDDRTMTGLVFPRYHQLDAVRALVADAREAGAGKSYLVQHSAGSGKSFTIAWLAHHLSTLHDAADRPVFDTVVVLTDRRVLDAQLSRTIESVEHKGGVLRRVTEEDGSAGLREALNSGARIVTSTIQKFPYICSETRVSGRRFAVVIDEAHSSQTGRANAKMKMALMDRDVDPDPDAWDAEDELAQEMRAQGQIPNISFFAFTATPKAATLEVFGTRDALCRRDADGAPLPRPFHLYSMRQAIEEGFILDVLENYTCFETYFKLAKTIADDPQYAEAKANRALMGIAEWNPAMVGKKAEIIVEHFMGNVEGVLDHRSKAMVVTWSRPMAYRLYRAMEAYIEERRYDCGLMVAFSGSLEVDGEEVTESRVNGVPESRTASAFDADDRRIIVCANKFQTGFDQPKLCAMYVDKQLTGVAAVQTLSRLNRTCPIPGKRTFVLDFANDWETIRASFSTYYEATELDATTDPDVLYDLSRRLEGYHVWEEREVEAAASAYLSSEDPAGTLSEVERWLAPGVDRWRELDDTPKREFKALLRKFLRGYSFVTQMVAMGDPRLHRRFVYGGLLIKKLFIETAATPDLRDKVELEYLRIEDLGTQAIRLQKEVLHNGGANAGISKEEEEERLSVLVEHINEAFGTEWEDADKIIRACADKICEDEEFVQRARTNSMGDLRAIFDEVALDALDSILTDGQDMMEKFSEHYDQYMRIVNEDLLPIVYRRINGESEVS